MARKPDPHMIDDEKPEWTEEEVARAKPASEVLPSELYAELTKRPRGRPKSETPKVAVTSCALTAAWSSTSSPRTGLADPDEGRPSSVGGDVTSHLAAQCIFGGSDPGAHRVRRLRRDARPGGRSSPGLRALGDGPRGPAPRAAAEAEYA